jgi:hypothetical protein
MVGPRTSWDTERVELLAPVELGVLPRFCMFMVIESSGRHLERYEEKDAW